MICSAYATNQWWHWPSWCSNSYASPNLAILTFGRVFHQKLYHEGSHRRTFPIFVYTTNSQTLQIRRNLCSSTLDALLCKQQNYDFIANIAPRSFEMSCGPSNLTVKAVIHRSRIRIMFFTFSSLTNSPPKSPVRNNAKTPMNVDIISIFSSKGVAPRVRLWCQPQGGFAGALHHHVKALFREVQE